jgi:protein SCO1
MSVLRIAILLLSWVLLRPLVPDLRAANTPQDLTRGIVYEQHLGEQVSLDLTFEDEQDRPVKLGDYFHGPPVVLMLGYFRCSMLCGVGLDATTRTIEEFPPDSASRDFEFIFVSVDPTENYVAALAKKGECLRKLGWKPATGRWHFLTGSAAAAQLAKEVGFNYRFDPAGKQYIHPSGLVFLAPQGNVTSYLLGIDYPAPEFDRALANARRGKPEPIGDILSILCFAHDPAVGTAGYYVLVALRGGAILTLCGLVLLVKSTRLRSGRS